MYAFNVEELKDVFKSILRDNIPAAEYDWLTGKELSAQNIMQFNTAFVTIPRKTGRLPITCTQQQLASIAKARNRLVVGHWTTDVLARAWLILQLNTSDKAKYFANIETLFVAAEVHELVALYSSLPIFAYPGMWASRCSEGIRNNIGDVLTAIMCNNPYPSEFLNEPAWNQMVLKAFFTGKPIDQILGLNERANSNLAKTLVDYAHERWAAHRQVNPLLWRCVAPFIDDQVLPDIQKIASSDNELERNAAALAASESKNPNAKRFLTEEYRREIESGKLSWKILSEKMNDYVLQ
jgi:hypothetical protein